MRAECRCQVHEFIVERQANLRDDLDQQVPHGATVAVIISDPLMFPNLSKTPVELDQI